MKKIFIFGFFVTSFVSLAIFISAVEAVSVVRAAEASPAVTKCLDTCTGTCNENASTGVVTCSTDAASSTGCPSGQVMDGFGTCATQATIDAQNTAATAAQNQPSTQSVTPTGSSGFTALAPIPGLTDAQTTSVLNGNTLAKFFNNLYKYLIGLAATLAVIEIIWAGLDISFFHKDAVSAIVDDKGRIYNAIFGLILVLSPYLVFSIINPSILNLSLNLPKIVLDIPAVSSGGGGGPVVDPTSGCTASGTSGILQIATCPSADAASKWGQQNCSSPSLALYTTNKKSSANGVASYIDTCSGTTSYVFIDTSTIPNPINVIKLLLPLVHSPERPNNGSDAVNFAAICHNANVGLQTCVSDAPVYTFATPCTIDPVGPNVGTKWKCYIERLSCESSYVSGKCTDSPPWSPFQ